MARSRFIRGLFRQAPAAPAVEPATANEACAQERDLVRRRAFETGRAVIELRLLLDREEMPWQEVEAAADRLAAAARAIRFCAIRAISFE